MAEISKEKRSKMMAAVHSRDTKPELTVRKYLWRLGFRYRLNLNHLPGHPDIVLRKYRTCIFVNGCFWHGHDCKDFRMPKTHVEFWENKIRRNQERDKEEHRKLAKMGWHVIVVWECELSPERREDTLKGLAFTLNHIYLKDRTVRYKPIDDYMDMAAEPMPDDTSR